MDVQSERRKERTGGLGWRITAVNDFHAQRARKPFVIKEKAKPNSV